jgi:hypothetical protein
VAFSPEVEDSGWLNQFSFVDVRQNPQSLHQQLLPERQQPVLQVVRYQQLSLPFQYWKEQELWLWLRQNRY